MLKDIEQKKILHAKIVIVPFEEDENVWDVFIINEYDKMLSNVMVTSYGYGERNGEKVKTTKLRHYFEGIMPNAYCKLEPISKDCFELTNEYWVSFQYDGFLYDKKYIFVNGSISTDYLTDISIMETRGVVHS